MSVHGPLERERVARSATACSAAIAGGRAASRTSGPLEPSSASYDGFVIGLLCELVELESPTGDTAAMRGRMAAELTELGGRVVLEGEHVLADFAGAGAPLLLLGHIDTVWPRGTLASMPWRVGDGCAYGPGSYDMKAGLVVMLEAIRRAGTGRALRQSVVGGKVHPVVGQGEFADDGVVDGEARIPLTIGDPRRMDGAFMESCGRNGWQPLATGAAPKPLPPVAVSCVHKHMVRGRRGSSPSEGPAKSL
jgi:Peptidase family M20/M25/M40